MLSPWKKSYDQPGQHIKKQRHYFANKGPSSQSYGFSSSHVWMWELDNTEPKHWRMMLLICGVGEDSWESLGLQGDQSVLKKSWIFIRRTDAKAETPVLWLPDAKNWLIGKDPEAGKDSRQEKRMTEDEMVGWHHWINGHKFEQTPGDGEDQWSLVCCSPWGHKESDMTEWLYNKQKIYSSVVKAMVFQ